MIAMRLFRTVEVTIIEEEADGISERWSGPASPTSYTSHTFQLADHLVLSGLEAVVYKQLEETFQIVERACPLSGVRGQRE